MSKNIVTATVSIKGIRPLFWHKFGPDALPLERQERTGVAGHDPEEWRKTVLVNKGGQLFLEPSYVFGALREGAKFSKKGKGTLQAAVSATLQVTDDRILIDRYFPGWPKDDQVFNVLTAEPPAQDPEAPLYLDVRGVRNPSTKARNIRYRIAASSGWECTFHLSFDKTVISQTEIDLIAIDTGRLIGVGNARTLGFGRFEVASFEIFDAT